MNSKKATLGALAVVAIAVSLYFLFHTPIDKAEAVATDVSEALGQRAGEEVAQLIGHPGRVAVLELELKPGQAPSAAASLERFRRTLKKHGITVARTKAMPGGLTALIMGGSVSKEAYLGLVEGAPSVDAAVTFAGLPNCPAEELQQFQATHAPLVVVDIFGVMKGPLLPTLVEQKTVALAFTPRSASEVEQQANEPRMFERYYRILRPAAK